MRDDLLDAEASIAWAVSSLPSLQERLSSWLDLNVYLHVEDEPPPATHNPVVLVEKEPLPRAFNVEAGAYLNVIRSSLDILATSLANRHGIRRPDRAYFPHAKSVEAFTQGNYRGHEFVEGLPDGERAIIEMLKPYDGGNGLLADLHSLDIMRKHRRLIAVSLRPLSFSVTGTGPIADYFQPIATGWVNANEKTAIALIRKDAPDYKMQFTPDVAFSEGAIVNRLPVVDAIHQFASHAASIIRLFDTH